MGQAVVVLKKGEGRTLKAGGMWVYDNEIASVTGSYEDGDMVIDVGDHVQTALVSAALILRLEPRFHDVFCLVGSDHSAAQRDDVGIVVALGHLRHESVGGDCGTDAFDLVRRDGDADAGAAHEHARVAFAGSHRLRDLEPVDGIVHRLLGESAEVDDLCAEILEGLFDGGFQHDAAVITADCNFHNSPLIG